MAKWSDFPDATAEAVRLRDENARLREINAEQAQQIESLKARLRSYQQDIRIIMARSGE